MTRQSGGASHALDPHTLDAILRPMRRRALLTGGLALSGAAVALLGGRDALAARATAGDPAADARILNSALGAELQAIAAYQLGAESKLLGADALKLALQFQGHHKEHAEALAQTVRKLGGTPVEAKRDYRFATDRLKTQADVLRFAAGLEQGAVSAYLGAVPLFGDRDLAKVAASILGDEAMHWAVLRHVLADSPVVPTAFVS